MPKQERFDTQYPGVYYVMGTSVASGKPERIYYIRYRKGGKSIEERAGRQFQDGMTAARANQQRARKIEGNESSNQEKRETERLAKEAEAGRWTVSRLWQEYRIQKGSYKTLRTDETNYKHLQSAFADKEPREISKQDVKELEKRLSASMKPQTVKHVLALLKRIVNSGVKNGLCAGLSFSIDMPKVYNIKTEDLTPEQLAKLLEVIEEDENVQAANLMKMALFTGMRRGELFKLKWADIDFQRGFIHIRDPKGGPDQKIPLNDPARELLLAHSRAGSDYVFPGRGGNQRVDIKRQVNRIKEKAGIPKDFRACHGLRHVYASMLASSGKVDMYTLQKLLTHKHPLMTQRYSHLRDDALRRASDLAGDIINDAINGKSQGAVDLQR